jgi:hypothetical protein
MTSRERTIEVSVINIAMPEPHGANRYIDLLLRMDSLDIAVDLQGDWKGRISITSSKEEDIANGFIEGDFSKYIDLDSTREWFNLISKKPAEENDMRAVSIPDHLKPHLQYVPFMFSLTGHRLIFVTKDGRDSVSTRQAESILKCLLENELILNEFGDVSVTVEPSTDALNNILDMPSLKKLDITITPPNPDDFSDYDDDVYKYLREQSASSYKISLETSQDGVLEPNNKTRALANVAQSNGFVSGEGGLRGQRQTMSTKEHPLTIRDKYNPGMETRASYLRRKSSEIMGILRGRR